MDMVTRSLALPEQHIVGFRRRRDETIETLFSATRELESQRSLPERDCLSILAGSWNQSREAWIVPLAQERADVKAMQKSADYPKLPAELKKIFDAGMILRTSVHAQFDEDGFSALMYATDSYKPMGRTGVLLHNRKPVVVAVDHKDFIVEIKGVGTPNGNNTITDLVTASSYFGQGRDRWGGLEVDDGEFEYQNLEILRQEKAKMFEDGNSPRALLFLKYDGKLRYFGENKDQAYVLRLAPGSLRSSFAANKSLPRHHPSKVARDLAQQFIELIKLDSVLIHTSAHPENLLYTPDGFKLTDYADVRTLAQLAEPHGVILSAFTNYVDEIPGLTSNNKLEYCQVLSGGLGILGERSKNTTLLAEEIWKRYIAPRVFELHKKGINASRDHVFLELEKLREFGDHYEPLETIDERIDRRARHWLKLQERRLRMMENSVEDSSEWIPKYAAIQGKVAASRKFFEGRFNHLSDRQLLNKGELEYRRMIEEKPAKQTQLRKARKEVALGKKYLGNCQKFAKVDPGVVPGVTSALYEIEEHLHREIDLLSVIPGQRQSIEVAQERIREIRNSYKDTYTVVERLRKDSQYLFRLSELPYYGRHQHDS